VTAKLELALDDPAFYAGEPYDQLAELRRSDPVHWYERGGFWALTKHADVQAVSRDQERFSSAYGVTVDERAHPERIDARELPGGQLLITTDPPDHRPLRATMSHLFSHRALTHFEQGLREICRRNLAEAAEQGVADYADVVSAQTTIQAICFALDLPESDWPELKRLSATQTAGFDAADEATFQVANDGFAALIDYFAEQLDGRAANPRGPEDWMTTLATAEVDGRRLPRETQLLFCMDLLVAGNETSEPLISNGTIALADHPDQRERLRRDLELMPTAVNELLRYTTPVVAMARTATVDCELRDRQIEAGQYLVMLYGAANRDEEVFEDPDALDVGRTNAGRQLSFGTGAHICLGAHFSRLEARVLFEELLAGYPEYELAGEVVRRPSTLVNGVAELPLRLVP
jgi:cytochrome P450